MSASASISLKGLSPHVRGSQPLVPLAPGLAGSIPARAGEPCDCKVFRGLQRVYPRACGGAVARMAVIRLGLGLSPRMRGSRSDLSYGIRYKGSIPAHAGEPGRAAGRAGRPGVYPRACGGARSRVTFSNFPEGLSPRMRGSRRQRQPVRAGVRSIPAHAGEPLGEDDSGAKYRVYPRACGGALHRPAPATKGYGLSPRMRGSRASTMPAWRLKGLSPRMRGSLDEIQLPRPRAGSIPAHAGEPMPQGRGSISPAVYPRACGGASGRQAIGIA